MLTRTGRSGRVDDGRLWHLVSHEDLVAGAFHAPARDGVEGGRTQRLAGFEAETGVVPRASNRVAHDEAFGKRTVIVRAMRADREESIAGASQKNMILSDVPEDHAPSAMELALTPRAKSLDELAAESAMVYLLLGTTSHPGGKHSSRYRR